MTQQNFTVDNGLTVAGTGGNITGATNITAANAVTANAIVVNGDAGDITMTGGNITGFTTLIGNTANVTLTAETQSWTFDTTGNLTLPTGNPNINYANGSPFTGAIADRIASGGKSLIIDSNGVLSFPNTNTLDTGGPSFTIQSQGNVTVGAGSGPQSLWKFGADGNLTLPANTFAVNYANGTQVSIGGGGSYGDSNVVTLLGSFGSNSISTTGNMVAGYGRFSGTFDEAQASTSGLYAGYAGGTPRMMFGTGNTLQTLEIDNDGGTLRFYKPGTTLASLTSTGVFTATGAVQLAVYADTTARDAAITSPQPGMMVYITGTGMQVRGATQWNTVLGSGT